MWLKLFRPFLKHLSGHISPFAPFPNLQTFPSFNRQGRTTTGNLRKNSNAQQKKLNKSACWIPHNMKWFISSFFNLATFKDDILKVGEPWCRPERRWFLEQLARPSQNQVTYINGSWIFIDPKQCIYV